MSVGDVAPLAGDTLNPQRAQSTIFAHYSIPAFDEGHGPTLESGAAIKSNKTAFPKGVVLFSKLNPRISRVWHVNDDQKAPRICSTEFLPLRPDEGQCDGRYLAWMLRSADFVGSIAGPSAATKSRERVKPKDVLGGKIPLPPIAEQRRIADRLDEAMAEVAGARTALKQQIDTAAQVVRTAAAAAFERLGTNHLARKLGSFGSRDSFRDGPFGSNLKTAHYSDSGARVVRLQNIGDGCFLDDDQAFVPLSHYETIKSHAVAGGDVLVAALGDDRSRAAGRACVMPDIDGPAVVKADCFRIRLPASEIGSAYVAYYLNSPIARNRLLGSTRGATRPRINLSMLRDVEIPAAPARIQREIVEHLDQVAATAEEATVALEAQSGALDVLPSSLLSAAFRGEF